MLKIVAVVIVVLIAAVLIFAATRPDTFRIQRSSVIKAPPARVFALIDDFHRWVEWSPWEKVDPALQRTYGGTPSGKGATYAWEGNSKVGKGSMQITESSSPSRIVIQLDFLKPFEAHNIAEFTLEPDGEGSRVTWAMHGPRPYLFKVMHLFFDMDGMVGGDFEKGLADLKRLAEQ